jgi:uncharacterized protein YbjT (DUF2867 family)
MKTALLAGGTGLIGSQLLEMLLESERYGQVIALTRRDLPIHPKLVQVKTGLDELDSNMADLKADDVFCCLGTTMSKAGSKDNFYKVDFEYPCKLATNSLASGAKQFLLVSALGADKASSIYYNKVKGEIETAVTAMGFGTLHIFRPSLLLGPRQEKRPGEDTAKLLYKLFGFLIPAKYQAIDAVKVARAMLHFATLDESGVFLHESKQLQDF